MTTEQILLSLLMLALGLIAHFLKDLARLKKEGDDLGPMAYWHKFPYQSGLSVVGAIAGFVVLHQMGELSLVTAFGLGYMANSAADVMGKRSEQALLGK